MRKEIATQQKVIKTQQTRNGRLEAELKKRESQLADIFDGTERKRYYFLTVSFAETSSCKKEPLILKMNFFIKLIFEQLHDPIAPALFSLFLGP